MSTSAPANAAPAAHAAVQQSQQSLPASQLAAVVVSPEYCLPVKTKLVMQAPEAFGSGADHAAQQYHISDTTGKTYFMLKPNTASSASLMTSSSGRRQLFDALGRPLIDVEKKAVSLHGTWLLKRAADGSRLAEVKPDRGMFAKNMTVYINDGDKQPDFIIAGSKNFTIKDCHRNNAVVAKLRKGNVLPCFKPKTAAEAGRYTLKVMPGVDAAFITALAMVCEQVKGGKA